MSNEKFDFIFLDHDLGGQVYVDSEDENTGFQLCKHLVKTENIATKVMIHSWNEPAAKKMMEFLNEKKQAKVIYFPFVVPEFNEFVITLVDKEVE